MAVLVTVISAVLLRWTGIGTVDAARQAAAASERSAEAAEKSAQAAQESVGVNRETAASVARQAESNALSMRYQDAAEQLGHVRAPVRLAGAYAMARLADDWVDQRQNCVDVLCAYLRMQLPSFQSEHDGNAELEVRSSILHIIASRLHEHRQGVTWQNCDFDLHGAPITNATLRNLHFKGRVNFDRATFSNTQISDCSFDKGASFRACTIHDGESFFGRFDSAEGEVSFDDTTVSTTGVADFWCVLKHDGRFLRMPLTALQVQGGATILFSDSAQEVVNTSGFTLYPQSHLEVIFAVLHRTSGRHGHGAVGTWTVNPGASIYLSESCVGDPSWDVRSRFPEDTVKVEIFEPAFRPPRVWRNEHREIWRYL
jgi:hypothetical protein